MNCIKYVEKQLTFIFVNGDQIFRTRSWLQTPHLFRFFPIVLKYRQSLLKIFTFWYIKERVILFKYHILFNNKILSKQTKLFYKHYFPKLYSKRYSNFINILMVTYDCIGKVKRLLTNKNVACLINPESKAFQLKKTPQRKNVMTNSSVDLSIYCGAIRSLRLFTHTHYTHVHFHKVKLFGRSLR